MSVGRPAQTSRAEIIRAARDLLQELGLDGLSVRSVAGLVDTAPSTIYNYFGTKQGLLEALADELLLEARPAVNTREDPLAALRQWMIEYRQLLLKTPDLITLINTHGPTPSVFKVGHDIYILLQRAGFSDADAALQARTLHWQVNGFVLQEIQQKNLGFDALDMMPEQYRASLLLVSRIDFEQLFANSIDLSLDGLKKLLAEGGAR